MKDGGADLHAHTTASDGLSAPAELVAAGLEAGLEILAVTDHDGLGGIAAARAAAADTPLQLVPGIELSTHARGRELHLLGLWVDPSDPGLNELAERQAEQRRMRAETVVDRARKLGLALDMQTVETVADGAPIGRPHLAHALVRCGDVHDFDDAFRRYIGVGRPCFVPRALVSTPDAIEIVQRAGGVAVLAHPGASRARENLIAELAAAGLDGLEVRHPRHGRQRERLLLAICKRLCLLPSGGSDFHGPGRGTSRVGEYRVETGWARALEQRARARREPQEDSE